MIPPREQPASAGRGDERDAGDRSDPERVRYEFTEVITVERQGEARVVVASSPERIVLVERGHAREVLFQCPCGCGEIVVINVDRAAGPAWRVRIRGERLTLMPSVLRTSGCESHFVLWDNQVCWCRWRSPSAEEQEEVESLGEQWPAGLEEELLAEWRARRARDP
jgi:hypothetical protein